MEREKTSLAMTPAVRKRLDKLQDRLRDAGVSRGKSSQSAIIEALVLRADFGTLLRYFER